MNNSINDIAIYRFVIDDINSIALKLKTILINLLFLAMNSFNEKEYEFTKIKPILCDGKEVLKIKVNSGKILICFQKDSCIDLGLFRNTDVEKILSNYLMEHQYKTYLNEKLNK